MDSRRFGRGGYRRRRGREPCAEPEHDEDRNTPKPSRFKRTAAAGALAAVIGCVSLVIPATVGIGALMSASGCSTIVASVSAEHRLEAELLRAHEQMALALAALHTVPLPEWEKLQIARLSQELASRMEIVAARSARLGGMGAAEAEAHAAALSELTNELEGLLTEPVPRR